jgi:hypothetical protein
VAVDLIAPGGTREAPDGAGPVDADADLTLAELEAAALAADPDAVVPDDAASFDEVVGLGAAGSLASVLLPSWYMPTLVGGPGRLRGWRRVVGLVVVLAFLLIVISGLCSTYGHLETA